MTDLNKKIKIGTIINFILLVVIYVLCYYITSSDFTGACSECAAGDYSTSLAFGTMFLFIQGILGICLFFSAKKIEKIRSTEGFILSIVMNIFLMLIQIGIVFSTSLSKDYHGYFTEDEFVITNIFYNIGRILYVVLLVYYIALIVMAVRSGKQMKKEDAEEEM